MDHENLSASCENVEELQAIIHALLAATSALFQRKRGDPNAVQDFLRGQTAALSALTFLNAVPSVTEQQMTEVIQTVWRRYQLGPTLGNGQACQYLLRILYEAFGYDSRLDWQWWKPIDWKVPSGEPVVH